MAENIEGVRETIATLRKVEPALAREAVKSIKAPAVATAMALKAAAPAAPLSGMAGFGGTKATANYGGRADANGERPLVKIRLTGPGWTVASDMARKASPGESMVRNLTAKWGPASRWAYPTVEPRVPGIVAGVKAAVLKVERMANGELG